MRYNNLYLVGLASSLPPPVSLADAAAAGMCDRRKLHRTRMSAVCISEMSGPEMAVDAARAAIRRSRVDPREIDLVLHACAYYQGHDLWAAASYVQRYALGNDGLAVEVRQQSNGSLAALELAAAYVLSHPQRRHAIVTTGDRFARPGFDRWNTDPGTVFGDGGTAAVLSTQPGIVRVLSLVSYSDPTLEQAGRGDDPFGPAPFHARRPIDLEVYRNQLLGRLGLSAVVDRLEAGQHKAFGQAIADAGVRRSDIEWFVLPNLGYGKLKAQFYDPLEIPPERTAWHWGSGVGHLGAGDQIAGLAELVDSGSLRPGQRCALLGVGSGFTWSVAIVEAVDVLDRVSILN
jgi:3-oxoacyl-[acyl-carrier-protein] synthase-3